MTASQEMSLLYLAPHDHKGGASRIAWYLHTNMQKRGINSHFIVGTKSRQDEAVIQLNHKPYRGNRLIWGPKRWLELQLGIENNYFPGTAHIPGMLPKPPSLIHAHNLQGKYFDLRSLPALSNRFPFLLTLHDQWLFTGHCAFAMECGRWKTGCGKCPDLLRTPRVKRDATAYNWRKKSAILKQSKLYIATPSQWLMDEMQYSMLMPSVVVSRVINNGVDHDAFQPKDKNAVRRELGLPEDAFVLLYVVSNRMNVNLYKDYETAMNVLHEMNPYIPEGKKVVFMGLGETGKDELVGRIEKKAIPYQNDIYALAKYYQAADVYIHAARAENFPNVTVEALSCGTPVIGTDVGGIKEQVVEGKTGFVVPARDAKGIAKHLLSMIADPERTAQMGRAAAVEAKEKYSLDLMVQRYLDFYDEIMNGTN